MFGNYRSNFEIRTNYFFIRVSGNNYYRECLGEKVEKYIIADEFIVCPVEPVNKPKPITTYLLVEFSKPIVVEPSRRISAYTTFPIEIGVFVNGKNIDIFTASKQKYSLYGTPVRGTICRYWKSDLYFEHPDVVPTLEGVIRLEIANKSGEWVEVAKLVFNVDGMEITYDDKCVRANAVVKITSTTMAETEFVYPKVENMRRSLKLYRPRKIGGARYYMEMGL